MLPKSPVGHLFRVKQKGYDANLDARKLPSIQQRADDLTSNSLLLSYNSCRVGCKGGLLGKVELALKGLR